MPQRSDHRFFLAQALSQVMVIGERFSQREGLIWWRHVAEQLEREQAAVRLEEQKRLAWKQVL